MSTIKVDTILDGTGTGAPDFPNGLTGDGSSLTGIDTGGSSVSALTPAATVDIDLTDDYFTLAMDQNTTFTMSNVAAGVDTFNLKLTGHATTSVLYDMDAAEYTGKNLDLSGETTGPNAFCFSSDGLTLIVTSFFDNNAYQYDLTAPFEPTTAIYSGNSFSYASQISSSRAARLSSDGTKLYIGGVPGIYQYTLATANSLSSVSYASKTLDTTPQDAYFMGMYFSPDEAILWISGNNNDSVFQYTLSTAGDISTATYASKSFSVASQAATPQDVFVSPGGTQMLVLDSTTDSVYQYTLSTANDVSSASYDSKSFSVNAQEISPACIFFNSAGTEMFVSGFVANAIFQYTCDASVYATTTYPAAFNFPSGTVPTVPKDDTENLLDFVTTDGGATWYGTQIGENYK
tara:strand:+ start:811 stop:2022 length:1212 start_codon:yes stop_codon:yes gene_type:complete